MSNKKFTEQLDYDLYELGVSELRLATVQESSMQVTCPPFAMDINEQEADDALLQANHKAITMH